MTDLSQFPPLHPERIRWALKYWSDDMRCVSDANVRCTLTERECGAMRDTIFKSLEVVQKLQSGFGFAPDLYDKIEMAKTTVAQGRTVFGALKALKALMSKK